MREAVRQGLIRQSPCYSIVLPRVARPKPRFLAPDHVERLATAIDDRYGSLIYAGAYLGPCWSDLAGLKRTNLDLVGRRVAIVGALERIGNGWGYSEQMKTLRSRRTVSIPKFIADLLTDRLGTAPESDFVFSSPCGDILNYRNFRRRFWDPAVAQADLVGGHPGTLALHS
jgi:integrase